MAFTGIRPEAVDFYRELGTHNNREWWQANKARYDELVREPMLALAEQVAPAFGEPKVYRPYRDVRFSHDKTPYKDHQGLYVRTQAGAGYYFEVNRHGFSVGSGSYHMTGDQLGRYRDAVANDATGVQLQQLVDELTAAGYQISGQLLATRPRGVAADAPRLQLLRHKSLAAMLPLGVPDWMATAEAADYVHDAWDEVRELMGWMSQFVGEPEQPRR